MTDTRTTQSDLARVSGVRQPSLSQIPAVLTRSERRLWLLHRKLAARLTPDSLAKWRPTIEANLARLRAGVTGQPHVRNLARWSALVAADDVLGLQRVLTGLDRAAIEMREVSPMGGLLSQDERTEVLASQPDVRPLIA